MRMEQLDKEQKERGIERERERESMFAGRKSSQFKHVFFFFSLPVGQNVVSTFEE